MEILLPLMLVAVMAFPVSLAAQAASRTTPRRPISFDTARLTACLISELSPAGRKEYLGMFARREG